MGLRRELLELNPGSGPRLPNENNPAGPSHPAVPWGMEERHRGYSRTEGSD